MPKIIENLAVNGNAGAYVDVTCSINCRKLTILEDPNNGAAQGLQYKLPDDNFVAVRILGVNEELVLGNTIAHAAGYGSLVGGPAYVTAGESIAANVVAKLLSKTVNATKYRKIEVE